MRYYLMFVFGMIFDMTLAGVVSYFFNLNFLLTFLLMSELLRRIGSIIAIKQAEAEAAALMKRLAELTKE